jgi:hypothetical protein
MAADANWAMTEKDPKGPDMRVQIAGVELQSPVIAVERSPMALSLKRLSR